MIISLSFGSTSDARKAKYDAIQADKKKVAVLQNYNKIVQAEALALFKNKKQLADSLRKKRAAFVEGIRKQGLTLPLSVGRIERLNVNSELSKISDKEEHQTPSQIQQKTQGKILVGSKKAKAIISKFDDDVVDQFSKLDQNSQQSVVYHVHKKLADLRDRSSKAYFDRKPDVTYLNRVIDNPKSDVETKEGARQELQMLKDDHAERVSILKDPEKLKKFISKTASDLIEFQKSGIKGQKELNLKRAKSLAEKNRYWSKSASTLTFTPSKRGSKELKDTIAKLKKSIPVAKSKANKLTGSSKETALGIVEVLTKKLAAKEKELVKVLAKEAKVKNKK